MPPRLREYPAAEVAAALGEGQGRSPAQTRLLVKHFLARLAGIAPGASVEVRVPPYAAVQAIPGVRHTRGTPPAVIETDADTWIALATGTLSWAQAEADGLIRASGQRADLSNLLPLHPPTGEQSQEP